jgi:ectoine hydroxylase-related dioxygenase (phytanoyl-CoA dioxygenase family)
VTREHSFDAYGVSERLPQTDPIDEAIAELRINGYTTLSSGFSTEFIDSLKDSLDRTYAKQVAEIGAESDLLSINDADIARCMLSYEADYLKVATAAPLMELTRRYLGLEFVLMMQNGIINRPDRENYQAKWHRDLNYQHWTTSKPMAMNALLCIDEFTYENGATFVLPGTHHVAPFPTDAFAQTFERQLAVPAGSFLVLDAMVFHRAGINRSSNVRRAVNHVIGLPFMAQQIDIPSAMSRTGAAIPDDPAIRKYLNFRWAPAADAIEWRQRRIVR